VLLKHLVQQALDAGALTADGLATMTDAEVQRVLFETPVTAEEARRLWYQPHTIAVRRLEDEDAPPGAHLVDIDRLYLDMPLADGRSVTSVSDRAAALVAEARGWRGVYAVYWDSHRNSQRERR
jgi:hypothetical protein